MVGLVASGCQFQPVSASLNESPAPYVVRSIGTSWRLDTQLPVSAGDLPEGISRFTGPEYLAAETPPGEVTGTWVRQNTWYYPARWTATEEFWYGWMLLDLFSVDRVHHINPLVLEEGGASELFSTFRSDRFTAYYSPEVAERIRNILGGTTVDSIPGFLFRVWPRDTLVVAYVQESSPAWKAGIRPDDRLLRFDGRWAATSLKYFEDTAKHRVVEIEFFRPGEGLPRTASVGRAPGVLPSVVVDTLPGGVGYMQIGQFVSTPGLATDSLFQEAAKWLESHSKGRWILDLRDNGGGTIETARRIISALLPRRTELLRIHERDFNSKTLAGFDRYDTMRTADSVPLRLTGRPLYILQDTNTASSSEILVSALRENLGSSLETFGLRTYGKGIGQIYVDTPLEGIMAVTCLYLDPMRNPRYHGIGIDPDHRLEGTDPVIDQAWKAARGGVALRSLGGAGTRSLDAQVLEWNRRQTTSRKMSPLYPRDAQRPFPVY